MFDPFVIPVQELIEEDLLKKTKRWFDLLKDEKPNLQVRKTFSRGVTGTENIASPYIGEYLNHILVPKAEQFFGVDDLYSFGSCIHFYEKGCFFPLHTDHQISLHYSFTWLVELENMDYYSFWFITNDNRAIEIQQRVDEVVVFGNDMLHSRLELKGKGQSATTFPFGFTKNKKNQHTCIKDNDIERYLKKGCDVLHHNLTAESVQDELTNRDFRKHWNM